MSMIKLIFMYFIQRFIQKNLLSRENVVNFDELEIHSV